MPDMKGAPYRRPLCVCCGLNDDNQLADCGHLFCFTCRGRGHEEDCIACRRDRAIADRLKTAS